VQFWIEQLNRLYREHPAMHELDTEPAGFEWVDANDSENSTLSFLRKGKSEREVILAVCNFTPVPRLNFQIGVPLGGWWRELLNSDSADYAGSGMGNGGGAMAESKKYHGRPFSLNLTLPPLGILFFKPE
jgi:1,4-alpha-glucan branching enzyme